MQIVLFCLGVLVILIGIGLILFEEFLRLRETRLRKPFEQVGPLQSLIDLTAAVEKLLDRLLPAEPKTHGAFFVVVGIGLVIGSFWVP